MEVQQMGNPFTTLSQENIMGSWLLETPGPPYARRVVQPSAMAHALVGASPRSLCKSSYKPVRL